jgi:hypothetical protein
MPGNPMNEKNSAMNYTICGAKTRTGTPCKRRPARGGRCHMHGGKSYFWFAHPNYKHGWYSKYSSRSLIIYMLRQEGIRFDTYGEYRKFLQERGTKKKEERDARSQKARQDQAANKEECSERSEER